MTLGSSSPSAARTAANMSGPTTVPPSAVLQVVQTLTMTGLSGEFAGRFAGKFDCGDSALESEDWSSALARSITGSWSGRYRPRALLGRAFGLIALKLAPVRCTPPRRRLQSTVRDGRSPGSRVAAVSRLPGNFPVAPARARRLQLRGQRRRWEFSIGERSHRLPFSPSTWKDHHG